MNKLANRSMFRKLIKLIDGNIGRNLSTFDVLRKFNADILERYALRNILLL